MPMSPLAVDIETVGVPWDDLGEEVQRYLLNRRKPDESEADVQDRLALHPANGRIVAIGLWRPVEDRGGVLVEGEGGRWEDFGSNTKIYRASEREMLVEFWRYVKESASTIITYNGRSFDGPYLLLRSAMLDVKPSRNLVPYRYSFAEHCDLAEVLTFFRARPMDSLDFWCRRFGIASPKETFNGTRVQSAYQAGRLEEIAAYCLKDVQATAKLYLRLQHLIALADSAGES